MTLRLVLLPLWKNVYPARVEREIASDPALQKYWSRFLKKDAKSDANRPEVTFFPDLIRHLLHTADNSFVDGQFNLDASVFCNRVMGAPHRSPRAAAHSPLPVASVARHAAHREA